MGIDYKLLPIKYREQIDAQTGVTSAIVVAGTETPESQSPIRDEPLEATSFQRWIKRRTEVRFTQFTRRRQDPDNCSPKYHIDFLRSEGFFPDDTDDDITLVVRQVQVNCREDEGLLIEIL